MQFRRKIPSFIFGVTVGLLIGAGFFVFKINDVFNNLKASAKEEITVIEQPVKNNSTDEWNKKNNSERFKINFGKPQKVNYKEIDSLIKDNSETNINVAKDEMLSVKNIKPIRIGIKETTNDSAAANLADVNQNNDDLFFIEFWKTPLNSKGYRFLKNKIMLYGFQDYDNVLLYILDESYYIKCADQVYKIFSDADFKPVERVVDSELLAKIN